MALLYGTAAKKRGVSARVVAMGDYFNAPEIHKVDTSAYKGEPGNLISIEAEDDFLLKRVSVTIMSNQEVVESGDAVEEPITQLWNYTTRVAAAPGTITIRVMAFDTPGNITIAEAAA